MITKERLKGYEDIYYNSMSKTYRDGSKQYLFATRRVFRQPGWESMKVDRTKMNLAEAAEDAVWNEFVSKIYAAREEDWEPSAVLDSHGWPINWRTMPIVEMSVAQLELLEKEEALRPLKNLLRAMRRARVKVRDYALSTDMRYFVTFTLDGDRIDRYGIHEITKALNRWLDNMVRRKGLCYVMVPELHKDGAVHFHALINDALTVVDSGTIIPEGIDPATNKRYKPRRPRSDRQRSSWLNNGGRIVYNLPDWPYGFTTALQLEGCYEQAVNYVCKYISKGLGEDPDVLPCKVGGRWYYSGGKLGTPGVEYFNSNMEDMAAAFGEAAKKVKVQDLDGVEMIVVWIDASGAPRVRKRLT